MRFIITAQTDTSAAEAEPGRDGDPGLDQATLVAYMKFNEDMHQAGVLVASEGLNPAAPGARIVAHKGKRRVVDGPFAESKELVGGFYVIDVKSLDEAIDWALRCPVGMSSADVLEVRQLTGASDLPPEIMAIISAAAPNWSAAMLAN
ncbi:MAG: dehydrogenase [Hydrocarboniphaga sp.]|uniref:YciI family protein n=1 Tax=Hydrocarboniphaga sp. TaxID=2033016 RepID=UPI0026390907|nr:YciI family protein [Hydrocarboniphaga sp.]MDB5970834.1 dehydrogenase [Hydrocarboniphaga sp.]